MFWPFRHKGERYPEITEDHLEEKIKKSSKERAELERRLEKVRVEIAIARMRRGH